AGRVSADGFQRWFRDVEVTADDGATLTLSVPNPIHKFFIESNYLPLVQAAVMEAIEQSREICVVARDSEDSLDALPPAPDPVPAPSPRVVARERVSGGIVPAGMNPRNTFESFVVGSNNQFAYAAALAVAQAPAKTYNPFFI